MKLFNDIAQKLSDLSELNIYSTYNFLPEYIGRFKKIKKLNLSGCHFVTLPEQIGELEQLQELNLSYSHITTLPESIGQLKNLQILELQYCNNLTTLPKSIGNLQNLQKLNLRDCTQLKYQSSLRNFTKDVIKQDSIMRRIVRKLLKFFE